MKSVFCFKLFLVVVLIGMFSCFCMAQLSPAEMNSLTAQKINGMGGEGTCACCDWHKCYEYHEYCGSEDWADPVTATAKVCDCKTAQNAACEEDHEVCHRPEQTDGHKCGVGICKKAGGGPEK